MDPEKQQSSRPIVMPKPRMSGGKLLCDSENSISQELSPIISSQRLQPVARRKTFAMGTKTPAKKLSEEKKVPTLNYRASQIPLCPTCNEVVSTNLNSLGLGVWKYLHVLLYMKLHIVYLMSFSLSEIYYNGSAGVNPEI